MVGSSGHRHLGHSLRASAAPPPESPTTHARPHNARAASRSLGPQLHDAFLVFQWVPEGHATRWAAAGTARHPGQVRQRLRAAALPEQQGQLWLSPQPHGTGRPSQVGPALPGGGARGEGRRGGGEAPHPPPGRQAQRCSATKAQIRHNLALWRPCLQHLFPPGHTDSAV